MSHAIDASLATRLDGVFQRIQRRWADQIKTPFEVRRWGDRCYRFGKGEPAVRIVVKDRDGLIALSRFDELEICHVQSMGREWGSSAE